MLNGKNMTRATAIAAMILAAVLPGCVSRDAADRGGKADIPIEEARFVLIGGIEQWITIRGANRKLPILLIVHGGPGDPQSALVDVYAPYEQDFIVVQWDQRGSGRTHARNRDRVKDLSLAQMADDGVELAEHLIAHLRRRELIVLGHSWGSTLALEMVKRKPSLFKAYVGTGQVSSWRASAAAQWAALNNRAQSAGDQTTLDLIKKIGTPDPLNIAQYFSWRSALNRNYLGPADTAWLARLRATTAASLNMTESDFKALMEGATFSGRALIAVMMSVDLFASAPRVPVPFFVIQGRDDLYTPTAPAIEYFDAVQAPKKKLTVIEGAGHFAMMTHPQEFRTALIDAAHLAR